MSCSDLPPRRKQSSGVRLPEDPPDPCEYHIQALNNPALKEQLNHRQQEKCKQLLKSFGWAAGTRIPFSDETNRKLEKDLEALQRRALNVKLKLDDNVEHVVILEQHFKRAKEDVYAYTNLARNKKSLLDEERNFYELSEKLFNRCIIEKQEIEKTIQGCQDRAAIMQKDLDWRLKGILELRDLIEFDSDALKEYHNRIKDFEEIDTDVRKLSIEDAKKIQELDNQRAELGAFRKELRNQLDQEAMNTAKFHEQFDRLSIEFRKVHRQRQEMIDMWAASLQAMKDKDELMHEVAEEYYELKDELHKTNFEIEEKERRLRIQQMGIQQMERVLSDFDRKVAEIRRMFEESQSTLASLKDALALCQMEITYASNHINDKSEAYAQVEAELRFFEKKKHRLYNIVAQLREKLLALQNRAEGRDNELTELEDMLEREEKNLDAYVREIEILRKFNYDMKGDKLEISKKLQATDTVTARIQNSLSSFKSQSTNYLDSAARLGGRLYKLDLEISVLENRIQKMTVTTIDNSYFEYQQRISELKEKLKKKEKEHKFVVHELEQVRLSTKRCNKDIGINRTDYITLESDIRQCETISRGLEKFIVEATQALNEEQLNLSLEKVFLKRMKDQLKNEKQQIFGLQEIRNTIFWAVKERKAEIETHRLLNLSRQKALSETVSKVRIQVSEVVLRTSKLRGRFELVTKLMAPSHDVDPEEQTMLFQVRKHARERESLVVEVHKWRARLEETEKELEGMTNVHSIMTASNTQLKQSLAPADENSEELRTLHEMNVQEQEFLLRRSQLKKLRVQLRDRVYDLEQRISVIEQESRATQELSHIKEHLASKVRNEVFRQKEKFNRWSKMCNKLLKEIKPLMEPERFDFIQLDLKFKFTQRKCESGIQMLERLMEVYPQMKKFFGRLVKEDENMLRLYDRFSETITTESRGSFGMSSSSSSSLSSGGSSGSVGTPTFRIGSRFEFPDAASSLSTAHKSLGVRMSPHSRMKDKGKTEVGTKKNKQKHEN